LLVAKNFGLNFLQSLKLKLVHTGVLDKFMVLAKNQTTLIA
jgi:hypothetical protein